MFSDVIGPLHWLYYFHNGVTPDNGYKLLERDDQVPELVYLAKRLGGGSVIQLHLYTEKLEDWGDPEPEDEVNAWKKTERRVLGHNVEFGQDWGNNESEMGENEEDRAEYQSKSGGDDNMFPIAMAVVESESYSSWVWVLMLLIEDLDLKDGFGFTLISDQQKGLEKAVRELLPLVEHIFCARHLSSNLTKKHPSEAVKISFWSVSTATHPEAFKSSMRDLERHSKGAAAKMKSLEPKVWSRAYFQTHSKCDNVDNNLSECFNSWILKCRHRGHKKGKCPNKPDDYDENTTRKRAPKRKKMTEQEVEIREEIERAETEKETGEAQLMEETEMEMNATPTTPRRSQRIEMPTPNVQQSHAQNGTPPASRPPSHGTCRRGRPKIPVKRGRPVNAFKAPRNQSN
ncbi:hypothetical protein POM88_000406 [Heracleum sosnowskyi]|uniref:MULE transposase domain-containing protein n=1 Tax=Heracleum sosnowskyi TaxID=360622 RepID=A0AAD8N9Q2_9APIA|nr:hypothetical protein POM88_000406 [Heracleum sosnowskyi]